MKDVYLICDAKNNTYKIGVSKNVDKRLKQLQTGNSNDLHIVYKIRTEYPFILESMLHKHFNSDNEKNEWFSLTNEEVVEFNETCEKLINSIKILKESNPYFQKFLNKKNPQIF